MVGGGFMLLSCVIRSLKKSLRPIGRATQDAEPPYTHNLERLVMGCGLSNEMNEDQLHFIDLMIPMNIEARYPSYKEALSRGLTPDYCRSIIDRTKEMQSWIKSKL